MLAYLYLLGLMKKAPRGLLILPTLFVLSFLSSLFFTLSTLVMKFHIHLEVSCGTGSPVLVDLYLLGLQSSSRAADPTLSNKSSDE